MDERGLSDTFVFGGLPRFRGLDSSVSWRVSYLVHFQLLISSAGSRRLADDEYTPSSPRSLDGTSP